MFHERALMKYKNQSGSAHLIVNNSISCGTSRRPGICCLEKFH